ncbi:MAG: ribosomal subunit interface protein [Bacteroidetes bacterium GWC2_33_15]|nr:MAG: ribosomal subunit interface protein [Bacteroidetes bacterium GWA2_33_15]OFX50335.1 MAG: ribosomal subunit interface protein [Bacteroidetes bacterium GWC2_33_15]OFX66748.1 MAG: ribosomal subunit interface protein [Bacteroidetes bacterium GWB2_32_14]OFX69366.1 MAG: ribosomal subunit interface protein [Bacteroidetes bacterium GWD2_33_33]HAN18688.1 ribosome-associated translation inhibitor RaiA [Bacteroidales bacterium]
MDIKIHSVHFDADKKLVDFVNNKVKKFVQVYDNIIEAEVFLRLEKDQSAENKITEIKLRIPGNDLFAKKKTKSFEESTDNAIDALIRQLKKSKEKQRGM